VSTLIFFALVSLGVMLYASIGTIVRHLICDIDEDIFAVFWPLTLAVLTVWGIALLVARPLIIWPIAATKWCINHLSDWWHCRDIFGPKKTELPKAIVYRRDGGDCGTGD